MSEDLIKRIEELERRVSALEQPLPASPIMATGSKPLSLKEFIISKNPKTSNDAALLIAYFLEKFSGESPFNSDDIVKGFSQAKEKPPANIPDAIAQNARKAYVMEAKEKKNGIKGWVVTNSGERYVENGLKESTSM